MLTIGVIFLLCPVYPLKAQKGSQQDGALILLEEGQNVTIVCPYQSDMAMHFSWYRHIIGHKPELISTIYKYESKATFYHEFKDNPRFNMVNGKGITYLNISKLQISDSATYYCGSAHSNIVEFGDGTELVVRASHVHILQQPTVQLVKSGDSVILQCTVLTGSISGDHSVYWLKHGSGESPPGIIYAHGDTNSQCSRSSETDSPTQSCVYKLPKTNLSLSDAGTYYCAVAVCGQILFGNGTKLNLDNKGVSCSEHIHILVLLSIIRTSLMSCCVSVIIIWHCTTRRAKTTVNVPFQKEMHYGRQLESFSHPRKTRLLV
ncbi:immunoglobulin kappa light chain-like [Hoplias malabaricus]|uniref:immunoglobulin kappa light chain-like n=1 Tax=Hoplias malabaricus TaxID=27720 RepID=UPI003461BCD7